VVSRRMVPDAIAICERSVEGFDRQLEVVAGGGDRVQACVDSAAQADQVADTDPSTPTWRRFTWWIACRRVVSGAGTCQQVTRSLGDNPLT
jgi:hypothetical protein